MELYLHFGIYKAGSSYIQYLCSNLRESLKNQGVYFPESSHDNAMLQGKISPGNAENLKAYLANQKADNATALLKRWRERAELSDCRIVLVSSEALVHALATREGLSTLCNAVDKAGFEQVSAMGFFRDLVDHAVSTYKHRAKSGKHQDFEHWVSHVYEAPQVINNLFQIHQEYPLKWHFRKFKPDSDSMREAFFEDWLDLNLSDWPEKPKVNESVTLSEVLIMQEISKHYSNVATCFVDQLKAIPKEEKANDQSLEEFYREMAYGILVEFNDQVSKWNFYFPPDEPIKIVDQVPSNKSEATNNVSLQLSKSQVAEIVKKVIYFHKFNGYWVRSKKAIANFIQQFSLKL